MPRFDRKLTAAVGLRIVVVGLVVGLLVSTGLPVAGATHVSSAGEPSTTSAAADLNPDNESSAESQNSSFDFDVQQVQRCGTRCRLITARLTNRMSESAQNVRTDI